MDYARLDDVYFDAASALARYHRILEKFQDRFRCPEPTFWIRAPGRVNVIGEHIDYSYFSCLPAAITADVVMAVKVTDDPMVIITNLDTRFEDSSFVVPASGQVPIDAVHMSWANYFKCGFVVAIEYLKSELRRAFVRPRGMLVAIHGNVPAGSGLSSSAAFVVAATLATLRANGYTDINKIGLTRLSMTCEQLVGVNSGGLDQAASIFGQKDHALFVTFRPKLSAQPLVFPHTNEPLTLLIANSLVESNKQESGPVHYNLRVVEVTLAANILAKRMGLVIPQDGNLEAGTLRGVLDTFTGDANHVTAGALRQMLAKVEQYLPLDAYTISQVAAELDMSLHVLNTKFMMRFPVKFDVLKLRQRATHVYEEALRVLKFVEVMRNPPAGEDPTALLGDLMNQSHESLRKNYENIIPEVDEIVAIARVSGAVGSRCTGAGWGGCTVHLVPESLVTNVREALQREYYAKRYPNAPADAIVESKPSSGVAIFTQPQPF